MKTVRRLSLVIGVAFAWAALTGCATTETGGGSFKLPALPLSAPTANLVKDGRFPTPEKDLPLQTLDLQKLVNDTPDGKVVSIPLGRYVLKRPLTIARRHELHLSFAPGTQLRVENTDVDVIRIEACQKVKISGCRARHVKPLPQYECHGSVIAVQDSSEVRVENCELNGCGAVGAWARKVNGLKVVNCHIHHNTWNAFYLESCKKVAVVGNIVERNANYLQAYDCQELIFSDDLARDNGGYWQKARAPGLHANMQADSRPWTSVGE
jgi:hypothetical protein